MCHIQLLFHIITFIILGDAYIKNKIITMPNYYQFNFCAESSEKIILIVVIINVTFGFCFL